MADEQEPEPGSQSIGSHLGKAEDMEGRGSVGGPGSDVGEVAPGDAYGSKRGAEPAQTEPEPSSDTSSDPPAAGASGEHGEEARKVEPSHLSGVRKGEELGGGEAGRYESGETGADRPAGGSTGRDSTSVNPDEQDPTDPDSPTMPTP